MTRCFSSATLLPTLLLTTAMALPAQGWAEVGDAGNLPASAQIPDSSGPLAMIQGTLGGSGDVDLYLIDISDVAAFSASTVGGSAIDTQLWLFDFDGRGIAHSDDASGTAQSTLTGTHLVVPGLYYLGVSGYDCDPIAAGQQIWNDTPYNLERVPDGQRRFERIDGWTPTGASGAYTITLSGVRHMQQAVLPSTSHLPSVAGSLWTYGVSSTIRFQVLHLGSSFAAVGATGGLLIESIAFPGTAGRPTGDTYTWNGVQVQVASTSLTTLSPDFATNLNAAQTTAGPLLSMNVTQRRTRGVAPNDDGIVLDLAAAAGTWPHDPTGPRPNLLLDVRIPTPPTGSGVIGKQAQANGGQMLSAFVTNTAGSPAPTPVLRVRFTGSGGHTRPAPARTESIGAAAGVPAASCYQTFAAGERFDLTGLRFVPDNPAAPTRYTIDANASTFDVSKLNATANATSGSLIPSLGFTHRFPGGSTSQVVMGVAGRVLLAGTGVTGFAPTTGMLLGASIPSAPSLAPFWADLNGAGGAADRGMHVRIDTSGGPGNAVCYLSWRDMLAESNPNLRVNMQCVLYEATGVVEFRYGLMPLAAPASGALVGWSRGTIGTVPSIDPGSRDFSLELPFTTAVEGSGPGAMSLSAVSTPVAGGRAFAGQSLRWNVSNVPPGALLGVQLIDVAASRPGFALPGITAPGCLLSTSTAATLWEATFLPGPTVTGTRALAIPPGVEGLEIYAQYVLLDGLFGGPNMLTANSNGLRHEVGRQ